MKFMLAHCELCKQYVFSGCSILAFTIRDKIIHPVMLGGEEPWSGVRVICMACREAIHEFPAEIAGDTLPVSLPIRDNQ